MDYTLNLRPPEAYCLWSIQLPLPPGANSLWIPVATRGRSRFVISPEYKTWRSDIQKCDWPDPPIFKDPLCIFCSILPGQSFNPGSDIDNYIKPIIDALKRHFIIVDDNSKIVQSAIMILGNKQDLTGQGMVDIGVYPSWLWTGRLPDLTGELFPNQVDDPIIKDETDPV